MAIAWRPSAAPPSRCGFHLSRAVVERTAIGRRRDTPFAVGRKGQLHCDLVALERSDILNHQLSARGEVDHARIPGHPS